MSHPARYRPYRAALWVLFFAVALTFVGAIIQAGVSGVLRHGNHNDIGVCDAGY